MKTPALVLMLIAIIPAALAGPVEEVLLAEQARRTALLNRDAAAAAALLADDLRYVHSNGKVETKDDVVAGLASGRVGYERFDLSQLEGRIVTADVVVLTGRVVQRKVTDGKASDATLLFHGIWRRSEEGPWQLVGLQTAALPPVKP